ncbi:putative ABC transporter ATP-binding protein YbhF [Stieleria maiorica]|uniref:Putative ABC transporter ATP-binding protein YbhF n=1 Tax=Stieleria maiorica TaxID=2795974 RepID=A0A5B9MDD6_9BACT|nr:ABC transporter ATP-binding protein [Stieleria maiorica]QEF99291.1 putative ABC transporter ATP-binding protein YbhF [Stieleria maiorica]
MTETSVPVGPESQLRPNDAPETSATVAPVVVCEKLSKNYGGFQALADCDLHVNAGDIFGLLGPNGAGKTTLIRSLLGYLQISGGKASVCGADPRIDPVRVRQNVSYLPGDARLPRHLRGDGVLRFFADIHPRGDLARSRKIADALELDTRRHVGMMSTGMRQKLALAVVLAPATELLILDEPTANLDPTVRGTVLELVAQAHREGRTVMFSSHVLSEIEDTCNRVAFLRRGRMALELQMAELFQRHRVWADLPAGESFDQPAVAASIPAAFRKRIKITQVDSVTSGGAASVRIDTAGDLAPMLPWITSLGLHRMRIEPLGLRAIYDSVHHDTLEDPRDHELSPDDEIADHISSGVSV